MISAEPTVAMIDFKFATMGAILPASLWAGNTIENSGGGVAICCYFVH
jgi:hypothetical protein